MVFPSNNSSSKIMQPADGSFDDPASFVSTELSFVRHRSMFTVLSCWADQIDSVFGHASPQWVAVGSFVIDQSFRRNFRNQATFDESFDQPDLVDVCRFRIDRERKATSVYKEHDLCSLATTSRSDLITPFFADENVPSANVSEQSTFPWSCSFSRSRRRTCSMIPFSVHRLNHRWHVDLEGKCFGKSFHLAPVRSTHRMPSRQSRGCTRGRPPWSPGGSHGNRSSMNSHCLSVSSNFESVLDPVVVTESWCPWDRVAMSASFRKPTTRNSYSNQSRF